MTPARHWALAGVVAGVAGLATSYATAMVLAVRQSPVVAVAEGLVQLTPGAVVEWAIEVLGPADKPVLVGGILLVVAGLFALAGVLARGGAARAAYVWLPLAAAGVVAVLVGPGSGVVDVVPVAVGLVTWLVVLPLLVRPLVPASQEPQPAARTPRRTFLVLATAVGLASAGVGALGQVAGRGRRQVEESRRLLRLPGVTRPATPRRATLALRGITPWRTEPEDFYLIHTAISVPTIEPAEWSLRIHGMVDRELTLSYDDLLARRTTEGWITLSCVSNPIGGDLVGNAWWSGVAVRELLAEVGVSAEADCVLQTSADGWDCATPLATLTDPDRDALLAMAMNGRPLPIEHGFPVRTIVPGLYGYVSATKWVVDLEVTRFDRVETFWTQRGWAEQGPARITSRIDVPEDGAEVPAGEVAVGGVAWHQHTGIAAVEVSLDGGAWERAELAATPSVDTWVQWALAFDLAPGPHALRVRAIGRDGEVQTGVVRDVVPDGATGWHEIELTAG